YLGRGVAYARQGNNRRATEDLQASIKLLPTAMAMNELGTLSLASNDRAAAKQYFGFAADAQGPVGEQARAAFMRLDIADNPGQYIAVQPYVNQGGRLLARIENRAPLTVRDVTVEFQAVVAGQLVTRSVGLAQIGSGQGGELDSGINFPAGVMPAANQVSVTVSGARVD
ncbi:MAG: hypothetical protein WBJ75_15100, partial [Pseudohongiellaceae bacterium]